jgi:hypothetical protein
VKLRVRSLLLAAASLAAAALASCGSQDPPPGEAACAVKPTETFHERIEPLLSDSRVSTCNECHLSGVDLSAFARETPCKTWACLVDQGLVNVASPEDSKILAWIERASPDSKLITPEVIAAEHDAFRDWIDANAACPAACQGVVCGAPGDAPACSDATDAGDFAAALAAAAGGGGAGGAGGANAEAGAPALPPDTRGCSDMELEQAFYDDVYSWRGRCSPCHFDKFPEADKLAPRWISTVGNCATGSAATFKNARDLGIFDTDDPTQSLILLKPLDVAGGGVTHGGAQKFADKTDPTYQSFLRFALHYKACTAP